jgi:hypothetical protein
MIDEPKRPHPMPDEVRLGSPARPPRHVGRAADPPLIPDERAHCGERQECANFCLKPWELRRERVAPTHSLSLKLGSSVRWSQGDLKTGLGQPAANGSRQRAAPRTISTVTIAATAGAIAQTLLWIASAVPAAHSSDAAS